MHTIFDSIAIQCFNLIPGAVICTDPDGGKPANERDDWPNDPDNLWVVTKVIHDGDNENVYVDLRSLDTDESGFGRTWATAWDYCDRTNLVGLCVNPSDMADDNCGIDIKEVTSNWANVPTVG